MILSQEWKEARWDKFVRECHELCASNPVHAVSDAQASKRSPNIMANRLRVQRDKQGENPASIMMRSMRRPCPIDFHGSVALTERRASF